MLFCCQPNQAVENIRIIYNLKPLKSIVVVWQVWNETPQRNSFHAIQIQNEKNALFRCGWI